jgi:putative membrane protein
MKTPPWRQEGQEPDYRFSLANERTYLAWIRTALAILAGVLFLDQFAVKLDHREMLLAVTVLLAVLSSFMAIGAYSRWKHNEIAMRHGRPLPHSAVLPLVSAGALAAGAVVIFYQFAR